MKILTISFTNHTARYLHYLEEQIVKLNSDTSFVRCSVYPSSHLYYAGQKLEDAELYNLGSLKVLSSNTKLNVGAYHEKVLKILRLEKYIEKLENEEKIIGGFIENVFNSGIDKVILIGDSRLPVEVTMKYASMRGKDILYIEQAPFNKMIFDFQGVNRNISFCYSGSEADDLPVFLKTKFSNYWHTQNTLVKYKGLLYDWYYLYGFSGVAYLIGESSLFRDMFMRIKSRIISPTRLSDLNLKRKVVFLPMQMPVDVQSVYHSFESGGSESLALKLLEDIPEDVTLLIKEHPNWSGKHTRCFYKKVASTENCHIVQGLNIKECFDCADIILTVNSTVGIEALNYGKQVFLTGDAYYRYDSVVHGLGENCSWKSILEAIENPKSRRKISGFLFELNEYLVNGHYMSESLTLSKKLEQKINHFLR